MSLPAVLSLSSSPLLVHRSLAPDAIPQHSHHPQTQNRRSRGKAVVQLELGRWRSLTNVLLTVN